MTVMMMRMMKMRRNIMGEKEGVGEGTVLIVILIRVCGFACKYVGGHW